MKNLQQELKTYLENLQSLNELIDIIVKKQNTLLDNLIKLTSKLK